MGTGTAVLGLNTISILLGDKNEISQKHCKESPDVEQEQFRVMW